MTAHDTAHDTAPTPVDAECQCGHPTDDHTGAFGCFYTELDADGETWLGCPCDRRAIEDRADAAGE